MKRKLLLTLFVAIIVMNGMAQKHPNWCGAHHYDSIAIANDPAILERRAQLEEFTKNFDVSKLTRNDTIYIPVVYHVLHKYGPERVSHNTIEYGIKKINKAYNAQNADLSSVVSAFQDIIGEANYKVRLAKIDPDGNPTTGIVYYETDLTYDADNNLKYTIQNWDPTKYLNIWSVASIASSAAAWSHYPGVSPALDGIVSIYSYLNSNDHTIAHEMGHYLNLAHPWGSTNDPEVPSNCNTDDGVADTPNTIGTMGGCPTNQESCGSLDNVQNIMDYSGCPSMFTMGQVTRMDAALNSSVGSRSNLWSQSNLEATGTNDGYVSPGVAPIADFDSKVVYACPGAEVNFTDFSYGGEATAWEWTIEGGTPEFSTDQNPNIVFNTPGVYSVSLKVINEVGENTLVRENIVRVTNTESGIVAPMVVDMEDIGFPLYENDFEKTWEFEEDGNFPWEVYHASNGNTALRVRNSNQGVDANNSFITSNIYLGAIENPEEITFDYAYVKKSASNNDKLEIYVSKNCGNSWALRSSFVASQLVTNDGSLLSTEFKPGDHQWGKAAIDISYNDEDEYIKLKFKATHGGGNYLYIDNIQVGDTTITDTTITNTMSANQHHNLNVYPNPVNEIVNISYYIDHAQNTQISFTNIVGEVIWLKELKIASGNHTENINIKDMGIAPGVYLVSIKTNLGKETKRIIIN